MRAAVGQARGEVPAYDEVGSGAGAYLLVRDAFDRCGVRVVVEVEPGAVQAYGHVGERGQQVGLVQGVALLDAQDPQASPVVVAGEPALADLPEGYEREDLGAGLARGSALGRLHGRGGQRDRGDALHVGDGADEQFDRDRLFGSGSAAAQQREGGRSGGVHETTNQVGGRAGGSAPAGGVGAGHDSPLEDSTGGTGDAAVPRPTHLRM